MRRVPLEYTCRPCAPRPGSAAAAHARGTSHQGPDDHAVSGKTGMPRTGPLGETRERYRPCRRGPDGPWSSARRGGARAPSSAGCRPPLVVGPTRPTAGATGVLMRPGRGAIDAHHPDDLAHDIREGLYVRGFHQMPLITVRWSRHCPPRPRAGSRGQMAPQASSVNSPRPTTYLPSFPAVSSTREAHPPRCARRALGAGEGTVPSIALTVRDVKLWVSGLGGPARPRSR